jgi:hypothetical protein
MKSAILFLVFNRPELTKQIFESIKLARPTRLYIAADGPRKEKLNEAEKCEEVRKIATAVDWPCDVKTNFQVENLGCQKGVVAGIDWFFEHEDEGIILEDDVLPSVEFFGYCDHALEKYRLDDRIGMITGTNFFGTNCLSNKYFYSNLTLIWGWATWKRAWSRYSIKLDDWPSKERVSLINTRFKKNLSEYFLTIFNSHQEKNINTWDTQWLYTSLFNNYLTVTPEANLIKNIGIFGTHSYIETRCHNNSYGQINSSTYISPEYICANTIFDDLMADKYYREALFIMRVSAITRKLKIYAFVKALYEIFCKLKNDHISRLSP